MAEKGERGREGKGGAGEGMGKEAFNLNSLLSVGLCRLHIYSVPVVPGLVEISCNCSLGNQQPKAVV